MNRWIHAEDKAEWAALFTSYTKSTYRLEGQQVYSSPTEDAVLARFLAEEPLDLDLSWTVSITEAHVAAGRTETRVRVVVEPPTDYTRLELVIYPHLAAAGEDIRIIAVQQGDWPAGLPRYDYWLFDDHDVWRMHYHDDFTFHGAELLEDEDVIKQHIAWCETAIAQAVPLDEYLATKDGERA